MKTALILFSTMSLLVAGCGPKKYADGHTDADHAANVSGAKTTGDHAGMAGMDMGSSHSGAPTMKLALAETGPLSVGRSQDISLTLTNIASGKVMGDADLALAHTKKLHLLIVDGSLTDYQHIHPLPDPATPGRWQFTFAPKFARTYKVWADVTLPDGHQEYIGTDLVAGREKAPLPDKVPTLIATADGLKFTLSFSQPLKVGQAAQGRIDVIDIKTGKSFAGLQPIMGAFGHIVAFAGDWNSIEHVHPLGTEPKSEGERSGPTINFHIQPEEAGVLKLFAQIRANGRETIVPFTANVAP